MNGGASPRQSLGEDLRPEGAPSAAEEHLRQALRTRDEELALLRSANEGLLRDKAECQRLLGEVNRAADGVMRDAPRLAAAAAAALSAPSPAGGSSAVETSDAVRALSAKLHSLRAIVQRSRGEGSTGGSGIGASLLCDEAGAPRGNSTPPRGGRGRTSSCSSDSDRGWYAEEAGGLAGGGGLGAEAREAASAASAAAVAAAETPAHLRAFKKNVFDRLTAERNKVPPRRAWRGSPPARRPPPCPARSGFRGRGFGDGFEGYAR